MCPVIAVYCLGPSLAYVNQKWALDRVKQQMEDKQKCPKTTKKSDGAPSRGMVVIPYVEGVAEKIKRAALKYNVATAVCPTNTLKNILVHPKDKKDTTEISDAVYNIPCKSCDKSYIGETGRLFGTRLKEHQKDSEIITLNSLGLAGRLPRQNNINLQILITLLRKTTSSTGRGLQF